jgi:hypothetical protein
LPKKVKPPMQSQLEAALLGRSSNVNTSSNLDDDENNFHDEEGEDVEDFADEVSFRSLAQS